MFSRKKTTISTGSCWDEGRKTATESPVEKMSGGTSESADQEPRESEATCKTVALRDDGSRNNVLTAAPAEVMCGDTAEPADNESMESVTTCRTTDTRDGGGHNDMPPAARAEVMHGDTAEVAGRELGESDATRQNTVRRDDGTQNEEPPAAPGTWLSGEAAVIADSLKRMIDQADAVVIGAGAGLSTSAGFTYSGARFRKYFADFEQKYGFHDMYYGGFYPYRSLEEYWAYWSRYIWINRYMEAPEPVYDDLLKMVGCKDYFVLTTNVDHCFQKAGFDKTRLFYTQGDYGLWQCSKPCHHKTYDNRDEVLKMLCAQGAVPDRSGDIMAADDHGMAGVCGSEHACSGSGPDGSSCKEPGLRNDTAGVITMTPARDGMPRDLQGSTAGARETVASNRRGVENSWSQQDSPAVPCGTVVPGRCGEGNIPAQGADSAASCETGAACRFDGSSGSLNMEIPSELVPRCPVCGRPMTMNLRADGSFVEDDGWHEAADRYSDFLKHHRKGRVVYLELGVGGNTPVIIKYPFWKMTSQNRNAVYACINLGEAGAPADIRRRSICIDADIGKAIKHMLG